MAATVGSRVTSRIGGTGSEASVNTAEAADAARIADAVTATRTRQRTAGDTVGTADVVTVTGGASTVNDAAVVGDASTVTVDRVRTQADAAPVADAVARTRSVARTAADTAAAADSGALVARTRGLFETEPADDAVATSRTTFRTVHDAAPMADAWAGNALEDAAPAKDGVVPILTRGELQDYQFVIEEAPQFGVPHVPFGQGQTVVVESFDPGVAEMRPQDQNSPVGDYRVFGTDRRTPPTWSWRMYTDVYNAWDAHEWAQIMEEVWDAEAVRSTPGAVLALRYRRAGEIRRVYGRPRDFTIIPTYSRTGRIDIVANFALAEHTYYADREETLPLRLMPTRGQGSGFTFPTTFPLRTQRQPEPRLEVADVRGRRPTWVDVTFHGPVDDPWVQVGEYRWGLHGHVASGQSVTMSGKPWAAGIRRSDGTFAPEMMDATSRLSQLRFRPGRYPVTYGGWDSTGSSRASLAWRPAYGTM